MATRQTIFLNKLHSALGTPYVWGGDQPGGFDCSGLVYWAARLAGIKGVPRTSEQQYQVGRPVSLKALRPGDLVFAYPEPGGPGHVVVYIGNGKVIAAPHTGTDVQVQNLSDFQGKIVGARRILANPQGTVYRANQFPGGGKSMQQDSQVPQIPMLPLKLPQFTAPTAQQSLQQALQPQQTLQGQQSPLSGNMPNTQAALQAFAQPKTDTAIAPVTALHNQLLKATS